MKVNINDRQYDIKPGANLREANLRVANLREANLKGANLEGANLRGANLRGANLEEAYLRGANLEGANLRVANLEGANLEGANLRGANLRGAYLRGANLEGAIIPYYTICPEVGGFYAFKKTTKGVIKIYVPADAKRTSSLVGRKCRAAYIEVISGPGVGGKSPTKGDLVYTKGTTVKADRFDPDIRLECTHGIHFFMTLKEAQEW
jgi:hypothetical protein